MSSLPSLTVDHEADVAYLKVREGETARTRIDQTGFIAVEYDEEGGIVGYRLLTLSPTSSAVAEAKEAKMERFADNLGRRMDGVVEAHRKYHGGEQ